MNEHLSPTKCRVVVDAIHVEDGLDHLADVLLLATLDVVDGRIRSRRHLWAEGYAMAMVERTVKVANPSELSG